MDNVESVKNIMEIAETAQKVLPNTIAEADGALATIVGWFNNVVLYPVKKANITYCYKLEHFENDLREQVSKIPQENLQEPPLSIAGPTLEALKYTFDETELRKMYVNLLASSMDSKKNGKTHPSYVEIIRQMNSFDAYLFKFLSSHQGYIKALNPTISIKSTSNIYANIAPEWYIKWVSPINNNLYRTSASLIRLSKLGIVELMFDRTTVNENYNELETSNDLVQILEGMKILHPDQELELVSTKSVVYVNDYGKQFAQTCL